MVRTTVQSGEARIKWRELLDQILTGKGDVLIERNGKSVAVMIPAVDYAQIEETLEELRSARVAVEAYEEWRRNPATARSWDELDGELGKAG